MNLLAAYLKPISDRLLSGISNAARLRYSKYMAERDADIQRLIDDPLKLINAKLDALYALLQVVGGGTLVAVYAVGANTLLPFKFGEEFIALGNAVVMLLVFIVFWREIATVVRIEPLLRSVRRRQQMNRP